MFNFCKKSKTPKAPTDGACTLAHDLPKRRIEGEVYSASPSAITILNDAFKASDQPIFLEEGVLVSEEILEEAQKTFAAYLAAEQPDRHAFWKRAFDGALGIWTVHQPHLYPPASKQSSRHLEVTEELQDYSKVLTGFRKEVLDYQEDRDFEAALEQAMIDHPEIGQELQEMKSDEQKITLGFQKLDANLAKKAAQVQAELQRTPESQRTHNFRGGRRELFAPRMHMPTSRGTNAAPSNYIPTQALRGRSLAPR